MSFTSSFIILIVSSVVGMAARGGPAAGVPRRGLPGSIVVGEQNVTIVISDRELVVARAAIVAGFREQIGGLHQVVLELPREQAVCVRVRSAEEGDALLDAIGVGARQRTVSFRIGTVRSPIVRLGLALLVVLSVLVFLPSGLLFCVSFEHPDRGLFLETAFAFALLSAIVLVLSFNALSVRLVRIGRDGVFVRNGALSQTFIPFRGLVVQRDGPRLELSGPAVRMRLATASATEAMAIFQRIEAARQREEHERERREAILARNGRALPEWREELRALLASVNYRAPVDAHELVEIVEDPGADAEQRVAAVVALSTLPEDARERVRVRAAIEATAEPRLRVALENASEGEMTAAVDALMRN